MPKRLREHASAKIKIPFYSGRVSCGLFGIADDFTESYLSLDEKYGKNRAATFFVRAAGDSMSPEIKSGDILIIDRSVKLLSSHIAAFYFNEMAICKQYVQNRGKIILKSFNSKYEDIVINREDSLELFGVVIGLARDL